MKSLQRISSNKLNYSVQNMTILENRVLENIILFDLMGCGPSSAGSDHVHNSNLLLI